MQSDMQASGERSPDASNIVIRIGRAYEVMHEERRVTTRDFADDLRRWGLTVELEVTEYVPGRYGLTLVEWTAIFIGTSAGTKIIGNLTDDLYQAAKELLRRRRKAKAEKGSAGRHLGFTIYGPDGKELRSWTTQEDEDQTEK